MKHMIIFPLLIITLSTCVIGGSGQVTDKPSVTTAFESEFDFPDNSAGYSFHPDWIRATWMQNHTQMSVTRAVPEDNLMKITVLGGEPFSGGSIQSRGTFLYGRWEARLKPSPVAGLVNAMFTMDWDDESTDSSDSDGTHQEIDIEFTPYTFGPNTGEVHIALHNRDHSCYVVEDIPLAFNPSDAFHVWGFEVRPDRIEWFVDDTHLYTFVYDKTFRIDSAYQLFFNGWTNDDQWVKGPPATTSVYEIDWVRFTPLD